MSSKLFFITGATGFIGVRVLHAVLEAEHRARISVRSEAQIIDIMTLLSRYIGEMEFVVVPDITIPDAFSHVLHGVDYILHIASLMPGAGTDFQKDFVEPAVGGTESILRAASKTPSVKRVVIMACIGSIMPLDGLGRPDLVIKEHGDEIPIDPDMSFPDGVPGQTTQYLASKFLAHQATQRFVQDHHPHFSVITLHPSFVLGRNFVRKKAADLHAMNNFNGWFVRSLESETPNMPPYVIDVRDVAQAALAAATAEFDTEQRPLEEILLSGKQIDWDALAEYVKASRPTFDVKLKGPFPKFVGIDTAKAERVLGSRSGSWEAMTDDVLGQQESLREKEAWEASTA
ncbi:hypothetical protein LTR56_021506 [Elasticomyces elasticus]|nr:hypothetical protein LTR56_021506 [Elasticomyces elasticus]KAK3660491.1 hypothetical protein LTR22_007932 [Elasticomyces elasticus]KAK4923896.1 hypothetical protein LTR49_009044 [Elasticomyces elasticus]KAK5754850.1 hypothetical protein LTS12_015066 [Elasticomyces elasticus]